MNPIFDYTNYRKYLHDYYKWAKVNVRGFSHRAFLAKAGMSGPNYLKRVMEGVHNLTENSIPKFATAMDLSETEATYFKYLVFFNQGKTLDEKDKYFEILMTKGGLVYPSVCLTFYVNTPYFLRFHFELRYRE